MINTPEEERFRNEGNIFAGKLRQIVTGTDSSLVFQNKKKSIFIDQFDSNFRIPMRELVYPVYQLIYEADDLLTTNRRYGRLPILFIGLDDTLYYALSYYYIDTAGRTIKGEQVLPAAWEEGSLEHQIEVVVGSDAAQTIPRMNLVPEVLEEEFRGFEPEEFEVVGYMLESIESGEFMQI